MNLFAQMPPVNWGVTMTVIVGLIGVLTLYVLVANAIIATRKAYGRTPPMHEQIVKLREEFVAELARHEAEIEAWKTKHETEDASEFTQLRDQIAETERDLSNRLLGNNASSEHRVEGLYSAIHALRTDVQHQLNNLLSAVGELKGRIKS